MKRSDTIRCRSRCWQLVVFVVLLMSQACVTTRHPNYAAYLEHMPRSILVLPPVNESTAVMAPYIYLSTVTRPLAERGYYVFPVGFIDILMKQAGQPHPEEMARVSLARIREIIDPDAVLYMTIKDWGTKYRVIDSVTRVHLVGQLIDADTGIVLWQGEYNLERSSSEGQSDLIGMLVVAVIQQIISNFSDPTRDVARMNNTQLFWNDFSGLLIGVRHPRFEEDQRRHREILNRQIAEEGPG